MEHYCDEWRCKDDGSQWVIDGMLECCKTCRVAAYCHSCQYCTYEKGLWLCNNPVNMKINILKQGDFYGKQIYTRTY